MTPPAGLQNRLKWAGLIVVVVLATYVPALDGDFVCGDDLWVRDDSRLDDWDGLGRIWSTAETDQYQPLVYSSFWLERRLWGVRPFGYHLDNVLLHAVNTVLVWLLLARMKVRGALAAAVLFGVHPVNVESVAWVYERKNVLSGLFFLLTMLSVVRFTEGRARRWFGLALGLFVCALLSKASTVVLPAVLLLYYWWNRQAWNKRDVLLTIPFFVMAGLMSALTIWYEHHHTGAHGAEFVSPMLERFARAGWIVWFYVGKLLAPVGLIFMYPRWSVDQAAIMSYLPHAVMLVVLVLLLVKRNTWGRPVLLALGYYLMALLPVLGFFDIYYHRYTFVADHFQYLASIGLIALITHGVAGGVLRLGILLRGLEGVDRSSAGWAIGLVSVGACCVLSDTRAKVFLTPQTLWNDTLQRNPECWAAHIALGEHLLKQPNLSGDHLARASTHFRTAADIKPDCANAWDRLGVVMALMGHHRTAVVYCKRAIELDPDNHARCARNYYNMGQALIRVQDHHGAIDAFEHALRHRPDMVDALRWLGELCCHTGRVERGLPALRRAAQLAPEDADIAAALRRFEQRQP